MSDNALIPFKQDIPFLQTLQDNKFLLFIPLLFLLKDNNSAKSSSFTYSLEPITDFVKQLNLDSILKVFNPRNVASKMNTLKKIGPYLPESSIPTINKVILSFEKINRVMSLMDFISTANSFQPISPVKTIDSKERMNMILNALKEEIPSGQAKTIGPIIDIITNADRIKGVFNLLTGFLSPSRKAKGSTGTLENVLELVLPLLGKGMTKDKVKEIMGMIEMFKLLNEDDDDDDD